MTVAMSRTKKKVTAALTMSVDFIKLKIVTRGPWNTRPNPMSDMIWKMMMRDHDECAWGLIYRPVPMIKITRPK